MNIAITGATGFIGSHLIPALSKKSDFNLSIFNKQKHSLESIESMKEFVANADAIIHLAGITKSTEVCYDINTIGTKNLLEAISLYGKPQIKFIFASTFAVYEPSKDVLSEISSTQPRNHYGLSKLFAEELVNFYANSQQLQTRILRIANVYGPSNIPSNTGIVSRIIDKIYHDDELILDGDGTQTRDYIYITDVVRALENVLLYKGQSLLINVCSGTATSMLDLVLRIESILHKKPRISFDKKTIQMGLWKGNSAKAKKEIGFSTITNLDEGLKKTVEDYLQNKKV